MHALVFYYGNSLQWASTRILRVHPLFAPVSSAQLSFHSSAVRSALLLIAAASA